MTKQELDAWLFEQTKGIVQTGPFAGMRLLQEESWGHDSLGAKVLGCYEQELHHYVEMEIARLSNLSKPVVANLGCAEGYYAVGMARRLPAADVYIVDIDENSLRVACDAAKANHVSLIRDAPINEVLAKPDLVISDCEGAEVLYLDPVKLPSLVGAVIIVEVHNLIDQSPLTCDILISRFNETHWITNVVEGERNPNKFQLLHNSSSDIRWAAMSEGRPILMNWFVMTPKLQAAG